MDISIEKNYEPKKVEEKWYEFWLKNKMFSASPKEGQKPFAIVIPPPNVTGSLHMGHALNNVMQDIIIRFKKMQGFNALWVPGTDHGGIATQNVVEKLLKAEGKTRHDIGREKFLERMWQWRKESGDTILTQLRRLGSSLDWERTRFTMDEICSKAVITAFIELYNRGLIYRGKRLVNWCPRCHTALADIEVEHEEEIGKLWHIKYKLKDMENEYITVATTRPETMLGDTAVAVHPEDERYKKYIGKSVILPLINREIPIVADDAVDITFGTGAVKVTPSHDPTDFEIAARHKLPHRVVIDFHGKMTEEAGKYAGLDRYEARKQILLDIEAQELLLETVDHPHSVGTCYRCNSVIEPLVSEQWFLKVESMSRKAIDATQDGRVKFYPASWAKPYLLWLENLKDWCISRQIWWGHRIPVYYCQSKVTAEQKEKNAGLITNCPLIVSDVRPEKCPHCGGTDIEQDPDVLDTWFSSALWPMSVFKWPAGQDSKELTDLKYFYPTSVLVTGHEILYLWVARMVQMGIEFMKDVPFSEVYIHGIVRDRFGKKMSKSLGNVIDPLGVIEKYGTDALRFALTQAAAPGRDMQLSEDSFVSARNFTNKIWNASRFIMMNVQNVSLDSNSAPAADELADKWIAAEYNMTIKNVTDALNVYNMDEAARLIYEFFWFKYCDWYIEIAKIRMNGTDEKAKQAVLANLLEILSGVLRMMHPIMPFISEEIWHALTKFMPINNASSIMTAEWPAADDKKLEGSAVKEMNLLQNIIVAVRTIRSEMNVPPVKAIEIIMNINSEELKNIVQNNISYIKFLARIENVQIGDKLKRPQQSAMAVVSGIEIFIPLSGLIDLEKEKQRLNKEISNTEIELQRCQQKMNNSDFVKRAPEKEIEKIKERLKEAESKKERLKDNLNYF